MPAGAMPGRAPWPRPRPDRPRAVSSRSAGEPAEPAELLGGSPAMVELRRAVLQAAAAPFPVLVEGESGTGKELVARSVHACGPRRALPLAAINCAAFSDELLETELFGHARGAFTGAVATRRGLFEEASGGTLFLDEVGELSPRAQAKLLRVLQDGEIRKVGESVSRRVDVRIVAATNRRLRDEVDAGRFRADLLYRLEVIRLDVPPLRARREDIALLAKHYWEETARQLGGRGPLAARTVAALTAYDWPGNVRELQNVLAGMAVAAPVRGRVGPDALPAHVAGSEAETRPTLEAARRDFDRQFVREALSRAGGRRTYAARELGLTRQGLAKLVKRLDL